MKKIIIGILALICVSCAKKGTYVPSQNAKDDFEIEYLFEQDGVKIYRFEDNGRTRYFATGNGRMTDSTYIRSNGKWSTTYNDTLIQ